MASTALPPPTAGAPQTQDEPESIHQKGRAQVPWPKEIWDAIDMHVHDEIMRTSVFAKFLPHCKVHPKTTSVPADVISFQQLDQQPGENTVTALIDEGATVRINETWAEFALTPQQVHETAEAHEFAHTVAVSLATRTANILAQAHDYICAQGVNAYSTPFFERFINYRSGQFPTDTGLLSLPLSAATAALQGAPSASTSIPLPLTGTGTTPPQVIQVPQASQTVPPIPEGPGVLYGTETFQALAQGYSFLQQLGHYGPYALVLHTIPYADAYAPVIGLVITADRIKPIVDAGFYGTGTLLSNQLGSPPEPAFTGVLVALDGDSMDLVVGHHAYATFMQRDPNDNWRFRVLQRFALRVKDSTAIIRLEFQ